MTRTAAKRVNWGLYKINQNTDKARIAFVCVFGCVCVSVAVFVHMLVGLDMDKGRVSSVRLIVRVCAQPVLCGCQVPSHPLRC